MLTNGNESNNLIDNSINLNNEPNEKSNFFENCLDTNSNQKSDESFQINIEDKKELKFRLLCVKCVKCPKIFINKDVSYDISCFHQKVEGANFKYFLENYTVRESEEFKSYNSNKKASKIDVLESFYYHLCENHQEPLYAYCSDCDVNLCSKCINQNENHKEHKYIFFNNKQINEKLKKIIDFMEDEEQINKMIKKYGNEINNLFHVIRLIIISFCQYQCGANYTSIENVSNIIDDLTKDKLNFNEKKQFKIFKKIRTKKNFENAKEEDICQIRINESNFSDLSLFEKKQFINLEYLTLRENHIKNIAPLESLKSKKLKDIDLSMNLISDFYLPVIKKIIKECTSLEKLNLFNNCFNKPEIFNYFEESKNLVNFLFGKNKLIFNEDINNNEIDGINEQNGSITINNNKKYKIPYVKEIGLGGGTFDDSTIKYISYFEFKNLQIIYLSGNGLRSLNFVKFLECKNLEEFWAKNNNIKEYEPLKKLKTLKKINLSNNPISNIDNLEVFIGEFNHLEHFYLQETKINKNIKQIAQRIEKIEKEKKISIHVD